MGRPRFPAWLLAVLLALLTIAIYWPATQCGFVNYDDDMYVTDNAHVISGVTWESLKWACLNPVSANWHPLTILSHMLDCQIFGLQPAGHHLTNVLFHALNAALVFVLLQNMTGARWRSLFVAALFAVHPLRVESVAWVSERKDVLSGLFGLLSLISYARYVQGRTQNAECRMQNAETSDTRHATRLTRHVSRFRLRVSRKHFLSALTLLPRPGLDEQADAGHVAVRHVAAGLLAAAKNAE